VNSERPCRILIVDDDWGQMNYVRDLLTASALSASHVAWTSSNIEALRLTRDEHFDTVLVDYHLGAGSGLDILREAQRLGLDTPLIMLTGKAGRSVDLQAMEAGASGFLDKRLLTPELLERAIRYAIHEARRRRQLRLRAERFEALVQYASDAILLLDRHGTVLFASESSEAVAGVAGDAIVGRSAFERVHPEDVFRLRAKFAECLAAPGVRRAAEYRAMHPDGTWRFREITAVNRLDDPALAAVVVNVRDVTPRRQDAAERAQLAASVQASEEAYRSIFENSPVGLAHVSLQGRWMRANARLLDMLGYTHEELSQLTFVDVSHPDETQEAIAAAKALVEQRQATFVTEKRYRRKHGDYFWVRIHVSVSRDAEGCARHFVTAVEDISERRTAEADRARLEEQFRQAQKMEAIGRLAGGVAHDFNNLLTAITGYSELALEEPAVGGAIRRDLEEIHRAAQSAAGLTRQLLAFSRRQMLQPQILDITVVVDRMQSMLQRLIGEDIELVTRLAPDLGPVCADPTQVEQIVLNLAVNARDAMSAGGRLTIETANVDIDDIYVASHRGATPGPHVMLAVADTGIGMDADTQARLFEPFFTTKERGRGTGLGLATVYGIVKQSGGSIWVYSEPGRGATFKIFLPVTPDASAAAAPLAPATRSLRGSETILVVEDQPDVRAVAVETLARYGYTVLDAATPDEALALIDRAGARIDLLFTDVVMPQRGGRELAQQVAGQLPGVRVIYTSGYTERSILQQSVLAPGLAFLPKPFTARALLTKVREVLDAPQPPAI
jgi:PAS domain S-box-containing protein